MGKIFYIMGKSATGKDHVYEALLGDQSLGLTPFVLYTTRPIRSGEQDGREYYFVNEERLKELRREGKIIEERAYDTIHGIWHYFTADDGQLQLDRQDYLGIGTLESYQKLKKHFGKACLVPIYIEVEDGIRLFRALTRERKQENPRYAELCRRFLADAEDFSEDEIQKADIRQRFENNEEFVNCIEKVHKFIEEVQKTAVS
ncbi:MAG: guanylate kinase [Lachnospiraceae bacterium]|nr:guanylate kinase [Lachnospiraceae bacterium]